MAAKYEPGMTIYLCAGTGMTPNNSIWWHRFAYPYGNKLLEPSWNVACFSFFKAHSISHGHWYCTFIDPSSGYFDVGKQFLINASYEPNQGEEELGYEQINQMLADPKIAYEAGLRIADYVCFSDDNGDLTGTYAWITKIQSINLSTARVYFTIDAIMSYYNCFTFGKCWVERDMQFGEITEDDEIPYQGEIAGSGFNINREPEPLQVDANEYIFEDITDSDYAPGTGKDYTLLTNFGPFNKHIVMSDINLELGNDTPTIIHINDSGTNVNLPPSPDSFIGENTRHSSIGVGLYYCKSKTAPVFNKLGEYNAMDHILASYSVPGSFIKDTFGSKVVNQIVNTKDVLNDEWITNFAAPVVTFDKLFEMCPSLQFGGVYRPRHYKTCFAPYNYYSIADPFGSSMEIMPQFLKPTVGTLSNEKDFFTFYFRFIPTVAFNGITELSIQNYLKYDYSYYAPLLSNFQNNTYSMTPNSSGSAILQAQANRITTASFIQAGLIIGGVALSMVVGGMLGGYDGVIPKQELMTAATTKLITTTARQTAYATHTAYEQQMKVRNAVEFGLPKAIGGVPNGISERTANTCGYIFKNVHLPIKRMKEIDDFFDIFGYEQNEYRYPHINTNRHWNYVKCQNVNIVPNYGAWGTKGTSLPQWAKNQIEERMTNGVTFWNLRWALEGDDDAGTGTAHVNWTDEKIQAIKNMCYVGYYGDENYRKENISVIDDYASEYSDSYDYIDDVGKDIQ